MYMHVHTYMCINTYVDIYFFLEGPVTNYYQRMIVTIKEGQE